MRVAALILTAVALAAPASAAHAESCETQRSDYGLFTYTTHSCEYTTTEWAWQKDRTQVDAWPALGKGSAFVDRESSAHNDAEGARHSATRAVGGDVDALGVRESARVTSFETGNDAGECRHGVAVHHRGATGDDGERFEVAPCGVLSGAPALLA